GPLPGRRWLDHVPPDRAAEPDAGDDLRRGPGFHPGRGRVRLGEPDLRQPADEDPGLGRGHLWPDRERRHRGRGRDLDLPARHRTDRADRTGTHATPGGPPWLRARPGTHGRLGPAQTTTGGVPDSPEYNTGIRTNRRLAGPPPGSGLAQPPVPGPALDGCCA